MSECFLSPRTAVAQKLLAESVQIPVTVEEPASWSVRRLQRSEGRGSLYPYQALADDIIAAIPLHRVNVLCTAPTGGGKSYLIEVAARVCRQAGAVVCVAEPLIALAEQMHARLLAAGFADAALLTGPSRKIPAMQVGTYVCTYEVLARMCCSEHPSLSACLMVAIDEVHFLRSDRGVVLQEILDACGRYGISVIALSGTLPNDMQVGTYLSAVNGLDTRIVGMANRPVQLTYYFWDVQGRGASKFWPLQWGARVPGGRAASVSALGGLRNRQDLLTLLRDLQGWDCLPALIVAFSCRKLTEWADQAACLALLDRSQKSVVTVAFERILRVVPAEDVELFLPLRELALRGIFMHHSHLPALYLDLVSRLAEQSCAPLVFSSSTLSAGINLPVRTVVLAGVRVPRRTSDGSMVFETIDPLLCHQLCGRAGRPGYETKGYVVVLGCGEEGYAAAQVVMGNPLPPITVSSEFGQGDVLRAEVTGRCLALDRAVFEDSTVRRLQLRAGASRALAAKALEHVVAPERRAIVAASAEAIRALELANPALLPFCRATGADLWLAREPRGCPTLGSAGSILLRSGGSKPKRVPIEDAACVFELKEHVEVLLRAQLCGAELAAVAILANALDDSEVLRTCPVMEHLERTKAALRGAGLMDAEGLLTLAGQAGAHVRSCASPGAVVLLLTNHGSLTHAQLIEVASLLLGDGAIDEGDAYTAEESGVGHELLGQLRTSVLLLSAARHVRAAKLWGVEGASLAAIQRDAGLSSGEASRHIVRVHDLLVEMELVAGALGLPLAPELGVAQMKMHRGLPFLRRCA